MPIILIGYIIDTPARQKRKKRLLDIISSKWHQDGKYIYLCYSKDWNLADPLERIIIPKYKDYMIIDSWSDAANEWTHSYPDEEDRVRSIVQETFHDYDAEFDAYIGFLDTARRKIDDERTLSYLQTRKGYVLIDGQEKEVNKAIEEIDSVIWSYLKSVGIID